MNAKRLLTNPKTGDLKVSLVFLAYTVVGNQMEKQVEVCLPMEDMEELYKFHKHSFLRRFLTSLAEKF